MNRGIALIALVSCVACGRGEATKQRAPAPRAITAVELTHSNPRVERQLTGLVSSWKQEEIGFEVPGRIVWVIEKGVLVQGDAYDTQGVRIQEGERIARIDPEMYDNRVERAAAAVKVAEAELAALQVEVDRVIPEKIVEARAREDLAKVNFERFTNLAQAEAAALVDRDRAESSFNAAKAVVRQLEASVDARRAELESAKARLAEARGVHAQAQIDRRHCDLIAPFSGEIAQVHAIPGGYVERGSPVVTLVAMDPVKVEVAVSEKTDRELRFGDVVRVRPRGSDEEVLGQVYLKNTSADASTHTFDLTLLVRNRRIAFGSSPDAEVGSLPEIGDLLAVEHEEAGSGPLFTAESTLNQDAQGEFVWRVKGLRFGEPTPNVLELEKVRVKTGTRRIALFGLYVYRQLADPGSLSSTDVVAAQVPSTVESTGGRAQFVRKTWLFRPGAVSDVVLDQSGPGPGYYVPTSSVIPERDRFFVFRIDRDDQGSAAIKTEVKTHGSTRGRVRIDAPELAPGVQIALNGAHYLHDGESIRVVAREENRR